MANNTANRLTIQIDLSGFSFKITTPSGEKVKSGERSFPSGIEEESQIGAYLEKELKNNSTLAKQYASVSVISSIFKYTLVPSEYYDPEKMGEILFDEHCNSDVQEYDIMDKALTISPGYTIFAVHKGIVSAIKNIQPDAEFTPVVYQMIEKIPTFKENNKILLHFGKEKTDIVAAERGNLLLVNSFPAPDPITTLYYLFMVIKEVMFNPEFTTLQIFGDISKGLKKEVSRYFKNINIHSL